MTARIADLPIAAQVQIAALAGAPKEIILPAFRDHVFWPCVEKQQFEYLQSYCDSGGGYLAPYGAIAPVMGALFCEQRVTFTKLMELHAMAEDDLAGQEIVQKLISIGIEHSVLA